MNGRMGLTQIIKEAWSGIPTGPRQITTMIPGCTNGDQNGCTASVRGSTPRSVRTEIHAIKACKMQNTEKC